jgi:phage tail sheath gpL-like
MTIRISDGLMKFLVQKGGIKEAMNGCCIDVYAGAQPANANAAPGALKLMRFTKDSGAWVVSVAQKDTVTITSATAAQTQIVTINGVDYTYLNGGSETLTTVAAAVAAMLNAIPDVFATSSAAVVTAQSRYPGVAYSIAVSGTGSPSTANVTANTAGTGMHFGVLTGNVLAKNADNWTGVGVAVGVAGWWRMKCDIADDDSTSATFKRMDGACNTANSDLLALTTLNIVVGGIDNITSFTVTQPQSA